MGNGNNDNTNMSGGSKPIGRGVLLLEAIREADPTENMHTGTALVFLYCCMHPGLSVRDVEFHTKMTKSAASRHVMNLTEKGDRARDRPGLGLVETVEDTMDSRVKRINLTAKGQKLKDKLVKIMEM